MESAIQLDKVRRITVDIVSAYLRNNAVDIDDLPDLIVDVHNCLSHCSKSQDRRPAVPIEESITVEHLICLICGQRNQILKRHLRSAHGLSPERYRERYGLGRSYPMTSPKLSESRRAMAKGIGLGRGSIRNRNAETAHEESESGSVAKASQEYRTETPQQR